MRTIALIEQGEDGTFGIFTPNLKSTIIGTGETVAEAKADFENSIRETMQAFADMGRPIPEELRDLEFDYKWDIASVFNYFDWINVSKLATSIGVTPSLMRYYKKRGAYLSNAQTRKIEVGLHLLADELKAISL
jgi:predicted RNase H-like HicB family nuclease